MDEDGVRLIRIWGLFQITITLMTAATILTELGDLRMGVLFFGASVVTLSLAQSIIGDGFNRRFWNTVGFEI